MKRFVLFALLLVLVALPAQTKTAKSQQYQDRGVVVRKGDSTFTMNVLGDLFTFKIAPDLLLLIAVKGDSAHVVAELNHGEFRVKYVVRRISGTVIYARRNLQEDFQILQAQGLDGHIMTTWADSTMQSLGDPREWLGREEDWKEVWVVSRAWEAWDEYRGVMRRGNYIGYVF